jgi:hypothetical protein
MSLSHSEFLDSVGPVIVGLYLLGCAGNLGAAVTAGRRRHVGRTLAWAGLASLFGWLAWSAWTGHPPELSPEFKAAADRALGPVTLSVGTLVGLIVFHLGRRGFVIPAVAWTTLNVSVVWLGMSLTDANFAAIVLKPDNLPIVAMIYLLGFFTWLATAQAVENDRRLAAGQPPTEHDYRQTVLVWPDAVYVELILAVIATVLLVVWSLLFRPVDGRRHGAGADHLRADGHSVSRFQPQRQRLLHNPPTPVGIPGVPVRLPPVVGAADRDRHVHARAELELLRTL